jgi:hypothetical protein
MLQKSIDLRYNENPFLRVIYTHHLGMDLKRQPLVEWCWKRNTPHPIPSWLLISLWFLAQPIFSTLTMEAICSSKTSVDTQWTTWHYIPEDNHCSENLKSYIANESFENWAKFEYLGMTHVFMNTILICYIKFEECLLSFSSKCFSSHVLSKNIMIKMQKSILYMIV